MGVKNDFIMDARSQLFRQGICANAFYRHALEHLESVCPGKESVLPTGAPIVDLLEGLCGWWGLAFPASAGPRVLHKKNGCVALFHTVHGSQHDTQHATTVELLRGALVADTMRGVLLEPACML